MKQHRYNVEMIMKSIGVSALSTILVSAEWTIHRAVVLTRHGERGPLYKDPYTFEENSGILAALTSTGERQCYLSGTTLRDRYINGTDTAILDLSAYSTSTIMVNSSDTDRTIASALAVSIGLFPPLGIEDETQLEVFDIANEIPSLPYGITLVPVKSNADVNDIQIRSYTKCPTYNTAVSRLYESTEFVQYEEENKEFFAELENELTRIDLCTNQFVVDGINLTNFYNLYDCIITEDNSEVPEILDASTLEKIYSIADWLEQQKHSPDVAGRMLGGNLLVTIVDFFNSSIYGESDVKLYIISGHYPVLKGLLSAVALDDQVYGIPAYAAYICIELLNNGSSWGIRFMFRNGPDSEIKTLIFPDSAALPHDSDGVVEWVDFQEYLDLNSILYSSSAEWCDECGNTSAADCIADEAAGYLSSSTAAENNSSNIVLIVVSTLSGIIFGTAFGIIGGRRWPQSKNYFDGVPQLN